MTTTAPPRPTSTPARPMTTRPTAKKFSTSTGARKTAESIVIYGEGGIGKSSLAALCPGVTFIDLEGGTNNLDTRRVDGIETWSELIDALREPSLWNDTTAIAIDSISKAQELAVAHTLATVKHEKGTPVTSLEGYGFGKGYRHVYETFHSLFLELDRHLREGRNIILIAHDTTTKVPNPTGDDFLQYQPAIMQNGQTGLLRDRVKQWCDHLLFMQYDRHVDADGKAKGAGSRTIYPQAQATFWAKSRSLRKPIVFREGDAALWTTLFQQEA